VGRFSPILLKFDQPFDLHQLLRNIVVGHHNARILFRVASPHSLLSRIACSTRVWRGACCRMRLTVLDAQFRPAVRFAVREASVPCTYEVLPYGCLLPHCWSMAT